MLSRYTYNRLQFSENYGQYTLRTTSDLKIYYRSHIFTSWLNLWSKQSSNKLRSVKNSLTLWPSIVLPEISMGRAHPCLSLDRTYPTHSLLLIIGPFLPRPLLVPTTRKRTWLSTISSPVHNLPVSVAYTMSLQLPSCP